jgi:hypothetical protein
MHEKACFFAPILLNDASLRAAQLPGQTALNNWGLRIKNQEGLRR